MDLKTTGDTPFLAHENPMNALFKSFKDIASGTGSSADFLNRVLSAAPGGMAPPAPPVRYTLHRVGQDVSFPVLVNDQPAQLPAMQVSCLHADGTSGGDVYILDDADNPLILAEQTELNGTGQIIKIYWDFPKRTGLEEELAENGRAKVYDLYFDFRSDVLRPESDKVLKEIAQVMQDHPDWKLTVEGHTDNIGDDASNLDLSKRRAAAVKQALVTKYGVAAGRLLTDGFGRSRPVDTNDTLEGRAHNRRVELVKE